MSYPEKIGFLKFKDGLLQVTETSADVPPSVPYIREDIHDNRVTELLHANNALLERAREAERKLEELKKVGI